MKQSQANSLFTLDKVKTEASAVLCRWLCQYAELDAYHLTFTGHDIDCRHLLVTLYHITSMRWGKVDLL